MAPMLEEKLAPPEQVESGTHEAGATNKKRRKSFLPSKPRTTRGWVQLLARVFMLAAFITLIFVLVFVIDIKTDITNALGWSEVHPVLGAGLYVLIYLVIILFCLVVPFSVAGGALYGFWLGTGISMIACLIGQTIAFYAARFLLRDLVKAGTSRSQRWAAIDEAMNREGWIIVFLLRLCIFIPYDPLNYVLGASAVKDWDYHSASAIGIIPSTMFFTYLGTLGVDIAKIANDEDVLSSVDRTTEIALIVTTCVIVVLVTVIITYYVRKVLNEKLSASSAASDRSEFSTPGSPNSGMADDAAKKQQKAEKAAPQAAKGEIQMKPLWEGQQESARV